ncbi:MAG: Hsp70 family protein [Flavobacteriales bacterium]
MSKSKINYGIDLGTTNSALARMENGGPRVLKLENSKEILPSCVGFDKKGHIRVGEKALDGLRKALGNWKGNQNNEEGINYFIEFKRLMGTDQTEYSGNAEKEIGAEELSSEVLKKLRSFVNDDDFEASVITVPAHFDIKQNDATLRADKEAGFKHCELLQEPVAASLAYGAGSEGKEGYWLVFDFGGGTFDAALVKNEDGILNVKDTEGDNRLGGKNLDAAIVDDILIPHLQSRFKIDKFLEDPQVSERFKFWLKGFAEEMKINLSFNEEHELFYEDVMLGEIEDEEGEPIDFDLTVTRSQLKNSISPYFQDAIDLSLRLLDRNNLQGEQLNSLLLVGGSTSSPILHQMVKEQLKAPNTDIDPMTAVAQGAALYASTVDLPEEVQEDVRDTTKVQLKVGYEATSVEEEEPVTFKLLPEKSEGEMPSGLVTEVHRGDQGWSSGRLDVSEKGDFIEVPLKKGEVNHFHIYLYDGEGNKIPCEPESFTINQGTKVGSATLPHSIGVEVYKKEEGRSVFQPIPGLEKNKSTPAVGTWEGLITQVDIRTGNQEDKIRIPLYQGEYDDEGTRAIYNELIYHVEITGEELPQFLQKDSEVELTLNVDNSGRPEKIECFFPNLDETIEKEIPVERTSIPEDFLQKELKKAQEEVNGLKKQEALDQEEVQSLESKIGELKEEMQSKGEKDADDKSRIMSQMKETFRKMDKMKEGTKWSQLEKDLKEEFAKLEKANNELGDEKTSREVEELRGRLDQVLKKQDIKLGNALKEEIHDLFVRITFLYQLMGFIENVRDNFDSYRWKDQEKARSLLSKAEDVMANDPTVDRLHPIVLDLIELIPEENRRNEDQELLKG